MKIKIENLKLPFLLSLLLVCACSKEDISRTVPPSGHGSSILEQLSQNYDQLPEQAISVSRDKSVYAQYTSPTEKYNHRVMGDGIEGEQLVVVVDRVLYYIRRRQLYFCRMNNK